MPVVALLIIVAWPFIEIAGFIAVGEVIGILPTIALILFSSALGAALLRVQGVGVLRQVQAEMRQGKVPAAAVGHAALITLAGFLLLVPGFASDIVGLLLFLPPVRSLLLRQLARNISLVVVKSAMERRTRRGRVVDLDPDDWHQGDHHPNGEHEPPKLDAGGLPPGAHPDGKQA